MPITGYSNTISVTTLGLLDAYPGAAVAYSVRKLRSAYTGSAIRVRRSSDNAEQDIGFSGGNLDTSALTSFCGAGNGFVTTWYDQSGNGLNVTQTTAGNQPQIVSSGSVINQNGKPALQFGFNLGTQWLQSGLSWSISNMTTFSVGYRTNNTTSIYNYSRLLSIYASPNDDFQDSNGYLLALCNAYFSGFNPSAAVLDNNIFGISYTFNTQVLITSRRNISNMYLQSNNGSITSGTSSGTTKTPNTMRIGTNLANADSAFVGNIQETILYLSDQSSNQSAINSQINTYYGIY